MQMFISDKREELEKEKEKNNALRNLFPSMYEDEEDDTEYYLTDENWNRNSKPLSDGIFAKDSNNVKKKTVEERPKAKLDIDPWRFEKMADHMQNGIIVGLNGRLDTVPLRRIGYGDYFEELNNAKFESVIPITLEFEGGYSNRENDTGGETKYGITKTFYDEYKHKTPGIAPDIKSLTLDDAKRLYKAHWDKHNLGYIQDKRKALLINDYIINSNAVKAIKRIQTKLQNNYNLTPDGIIGANTIRAINDIDFESFADTVQTDRRNNFDKNVDENYTKNIKNINGWMNRLNKLSDSVGFKKKYKSKYQY